MVRCTNVSSPNELTRSRNLSNFKSDFCKLRAQECRYLLERHDIDPNLLWITPVPDEFSFIERNSECIKTKAQKSSGTV